MRRTNEPSATIGFTRDVGSRGGGSGPRLRNSLVRGVSLTVATSLLEANSWLRCGGVRYAAVEQGSLALPGGSSVDRCSFLLDTISLREANGGWEGQQIRPSASLSASSKYHVFLPTSRCESVLGCFSLRSYCDAWEFFLDKRRGCQ